MTENFVIDSELYTSRGDEIDDHARLELPPEKMRELGYRVVDSLVDYAVNLSEQPVGRHGSRVDMEELLHRPLPRGGSDPNEVLDVVLRDVFGSVAHHSHPRFFGFVSSPSNFVSVMAEALVAGFNPFCGSWLVASGPSQIELVTIDWLRQICGLPHGTAGLFVSGGSAANLTALTAARHAKLGEHCDGATVYFSSQTHSSIAKALMVLGIPEDHRRAIRIRRSVSTARRCPTPGD